MERIGSAMIEAIAGSECPTPRFTHIENTDNTDTGGSEKELARGGRRLDSAR
jgi:hypothetical protein